MDNSQNTGYLIVRASSAFRAIPVPDAVVSVRTVGEDGSASLYAVMTTDESGETPVLPLETPPPGNSLSPGMAPGYSLVNIEVNAQGYYAVAAQNVPVFPGITSAQNVNLIPLPDLSQYDRYPGINIIINESAVPDL